MQNELNYLDRNEFNFEPSKEVVEAFKNFDINKFAFYTRIYDEGKKSIFSVYLSELYDIEEHQVMVGYGAEDLLKKTVHYFLTQGSLKRDNYCSYGFLGVTFIIIYDRFVNIQHTRTVFPSSPSWKAILVLPI